MEPCTARRTIEPDRGLILACQKGDREAYRRLFDAYRDRVYALALASLNGDQAAAEDVAQEVFVKLFTRIGQFRQEAEFSTWLYRLVVNACLDERRRRKRIVPMETLETLPNGQEEPDYGSEIGLEVQAALADLPAEIRMTLLLKYYEELSYEEMAQALHCSSGTIASRLHRGLKTLSRRLAHLRGAVAPGK